MPLRYKPGKPDPATGLTPVQTRYLQLLREHGFWGNLQPYFHRWELPVMNALTARGYALRVDSAVDAFAFKPVENPPPPRPARLRRKPLMSPTEVRVEDELICVGHLTMTPAEARTVAASLVEAADAIAPE